MKLFKHKTNPSTQIESQFPKNPHIYKNLLETMSTILPPPYSENDVGAHTCERIAALAENKLDTVFAQRNREPSLRYVLLQCALLVRVSESYDILDDLKYVDPDVPDS
jgi:hypothetical protein